MFGEPKDVDGKCNARCYIADNFGDNHATMRCQLKPKHEGKHREEFIRKDIEGSYLPESHVVIEWDVDEREL